MIKVNCMQTKEFLPYKITHHHLSIVSAFLIVTKVVLVFLLFVTYPNQAYFSSITSTNIIDLVNTERASLGLETLHTNERLNRVAIAKLQDMFNRQYFSHTNPDGEKIWPLLAKFNYDYSYAGENLAMNFFSAEDVVDAWMNSEKHKENIVSPNYNDVGVAVGTGQLHGKSVSLVVQVFGLEYVSPIQEFRQSVTGALGIGSGEQVVMGESQTVSYSPVERHWYSWAYERSREFLLLLGALLSLVLFFLGLHESKTHHKTFAYGLFTLCVIFMVIAVRVHFIESISGPLMVG